MVAIEENNQLRRHQTIIPRNKNSTLRYLYLINSCSTYNKNPCLHFYQQPMTMLCEVLGRITLSSLTPILSEFCLHFLSARFLVFFLSRLGWNTWLTWIHFRLFRSCNPQMHGEESVSNHMQFKTAWECASVNPTWPSNILNWQLATRIWPGVFIS